jgi:hypothetical protein
MDGNPTAVKSHLDDLLFDLRQTTLVRVVQDEGVPLTVLVQASMARLSLCGSSMSEHINTFASCTENRFYCHLASLISDLRIIIS